MTNVNPFSATEFASLSDEFINCTDDVTLISIIREIYRLLDQHFGDEFIVAPIFILKCYHRLNTSENKEELILLYALLNALSCNCVIVELYKRFRIYKPMVRYLNKQISIGSVNEDSLDAALLIQVLDFVDILSLSSSTGNLLYEKGVVGGLIELLVKFRNSDASGVARTKDVLEELIIRKKLIGNCMHLGRRLDSSFIGVLPNVTLMSLKQGVSVSLYDTSGTTDVDIASEMVKRGEAWPAFTDYRNESETKCLDIIPVHVEDSYRFWAWLGKDAPELMRGVDQTLNAFKFEPTDAVVAPPVGCFVCVIADSGNYRAVVTDVDTSLRTASVFALDYGQKSTHNWSSLRFLSAKTNLGGVAPQAVPCIMKGLSPIPGNLVVFRAVLSTLTNFTGTRTCLAARQIADRCTKLLCGLVTCPDLETATSAISILSNLAHIDDLCDGLASAGLLNIILCHLSELEVTTDDLLVHVFVRRCLRCLSNLLNNHEESRLDFFRDNGFCIVMALVQQSSSHELYRGFCQILRGVVFDDQLNNRSSDGKKRRSAESSSGKSRSCDSSRRYSDGEWMNGAHQFRRSVQPVSSSESEHALRPVASQSPRAYEERGGDTGRRSQSDYGFVSHDEDGRRLRSLSMDRLRQVDSQSGPRVTADDDIRSRDIVVTSASYYDTHNDEDECDAEESFLALNSNLIDEEHVEYYVKGCRVKFGQSQQHELRPTQTVSDIPSSTLLRVLCGFFNSSQEGSIYFGIDADSVVRGICASRQDRDGFRLGLDKLMAAFKPRVIRCPFDVIYSPVVAPDGHHIPELRRHDNDEYVIEIKLRNVTDDFYTIVSRTKSSQRVGYIRRNGTDLIATAQDVRQTALKHEALRYHDLLISLRREAGDIR